MYFPNNDFHDIDKQDLPAQENEQLQQPVEEPCVTERPVMEQPAVEQTPVYTPAPRKGRTGLKIAALCLCCTLLGGAAGLGGAALFAARAKTEVPQPQPNQTTIYETQREPTVVTVANIAAGKELSPAEVYASNLNACVGITVSTTTNIFGYTTTSAATGSGFVISSDGYIVTNYHVIKEAAGSTGVPISVAFQDGKTYEAKLIGGEEDNDVAVLKIEATGLTPVVLGDSDHLVVGEAVYAIGNPLGELTSSLTDGLVSALDRVITTGSSDDSTSLNMLQTNCAINSGNSGGPLFNRFGEVIGITTAKMSGSSSGSASIEGLGFAIPINDVKDIIRDLIEHGYVTGKPYMGVSVSTVSATDTKRYNLSVGAYVEAVEAGSCSEKAGLQVGDIITAINDTEITTHSALVAAKAMYRAGDTVTLKVVRNHQELELQLTFDEEAPPAQESTQPAPDAQQGQSQYPQQGQSQYPQQGGQSGQGSYYPWDMFPFGGLFG